MFYYTVLLLITVLFIISCSGTVEDDNDVAKCIADLKKAGISGKIGFINYCFAMQFKFSDDDEHLTHEESLDQIKKHNNITELSKHVEKFFRDSWELSKMVGRVLFTPYEFCDDHSVLFSIEKSVVDCEDKIRSKEKEKRKMETEYGKYIINNLTIPFLFKLKILYNRMKEL
ncbi:uncharacterized protein LOC107882757 isoform X1 [Acyrthosiphon pisum]|uniref:Uncharacterized protein n=1 Tax=Acyrthosiphon pisum TaxID=7029 RepID=A0A8R2JWS3_ACYPI|nr:uncharacterized protein LOC107882757 isoform X1 [Acyrthosiphon pisum]